MFFSAAIKLAEILSSRIKYYTLDWLQKFVSNFDANLEFSSLQTQQTASFIYLLTYLLIVHKLRISLTVDIVKKLVCLKDWLKSIYGLSV